MTKEELIVSFKYSVLQHARKHNNITYSCREFNISRTVYYKWLKRFSKLGYLGLQDKEKAKPQMPNLVLFSIGKSRKCKHHLKVIQIMEYF